MSAAHVADVEIPGGLAEVDPAGVAQPGRPVAPVVEGGGEMARLAFGPVVVLIIDLDIIRERLVPIVDSLVLNERVVDHVKVRL